MYEKHPNFIRRDDGASIPFDEGNQDYAAYLAWVAEGNEPSIAPPPSLQERAAVLLAGVVEHLNAAAQAKGYDSIVTASVRAGYVGPFQAEGIAFATWMDSVYARCYELLDAFNSGEISEPTLPELIDMLPELEL